MNKKIILIKIYYEFFLSAFPHKYRLALDALLPQSSNYFYARKFWFNFICILFRHNYNILLCSLLKKLCQIWGLNPKMDIFVIRGIQCKTHYFKTFYILKYKKNVRKNFLKNLFFMGTAIDFSLINLMEILQLRQKKFSHVSKEYISMNFFPA